MKMFPIVVLLVISFNSIAGGEYRKFDDLKQEKTYRKLINEIRCLVCQNQTIADSNAELAQDLRRQVYEMLKQGKTVDDITGFLTDRYGDFILYNPPFKAKTGLLWLGPIIFLVIGLVILVLFSRKKKFTEKSETSTEDQAKKDKVKALLEKGDSL